MNNQEIIQELINMHDMAMISIRKIEDKHPVMLDENEVACLGQTGFVEYANDLVILADLGRKKLALDYAIKELDSSWKSLAFS